jgi:glycosyltransferase 2 family protein
MMRSFWAWARPLAGAGILAFLLWRLGTGPFLDGLKMIDSWAVVAALGLGGLTTVCCAWRWSLVARGLGARLPLGPAVARCYRSVFLNATLPGGVLGDVHRAVRHGQEVGDVGRGVRAVVWERCAGQVVQVVMAVVLLLVLPSPVRAYMPVAAAAIAAAALAVFLVAWALPHTGRLTRGRPADARPSRLVRAVRRSRDDIRDGLLARRSWPGVLLSSAACVVGHLALFMVAARTAGATAPASRLVPLALLALLAMSLPLNVGGWGAREGVAAWGFGAAGLTVTQGVSTAVVYGALALVSALPGACVLLAPRLGRVWRSAVTAAAFTGAAATRAALGRAPVAVAIAPDSAVGG